MCGVLASTQLQLTAFQPTYRTSRFAGEYDQLFHSVPQLEELAVSHIALHRSLNADAFHLCESSTKPNTRIGTEKPLINIHLRSHA